MTSATLITADYQEMLENSRLIQPQENLLTIEDRAEVTSNYRRVIRGGPPNPAWIKKIFSFQLSRPKFPHLEPNNSSDAREQRTKPQQIPWHSVCQEISRNVPQFCRTPQRRKAPVYTITPQQAAILDIVRPLPAQTHSAQYPSDQNKISKWTELFVTAPADAVAKLVERHSRRENGVPVFKEPPVPHFQNNMNDAALRGHSPRVDNEKQPARRKVPENQIALFSKPLSIQNCARAEQMIIRAIEKTSDGARRQSLICALRSLQGKFVQARDLYRVFAATERCTADVSDIITMMPHFQARIKKDEQTASPHLFALACGKNGYKKLKFLSYLLHYWRVVGFSDGYLTQTSRFKRSVFPGIAPSCITIPIFRTPRQLGELDDLMFRPGRYDAGSRDYKDVADQRDFFIIDARLANAHIPNWTDKIFRYEYRRLTHLLKQRYGDPKNFISGDPDAVLLFALLEQCSKKYSAEVLGQNVRKVYRVMSTQKRTIRGKCPDGRCKSDNCMNCAPDLRELTHYCNPKNPKSLKKMHECLSEMERLHSYYLFIKLDRYRLISLEGLTDSEAEDSVERLYQRLLRAKVNQARKDHRNTAAVRTHLDRAFEQAFFGQMLPPGFHEVANLPAEKPVSIIS